MPTGVYKRTAFHRKRISETSKGMLGLKHSEETKQKQREAKLKNPTRYWLGKHLYKKTRIKLSENHNGTGFLGHKHTIESNEKNRVSQINKSNRIHNDTPIELLIENELKSRRVVYQKQVPLCDIAIVDFYLPEYKIVIQCDSKYWHNLPGRQEHDKQQDEVLIKNGFNVYRFLDIDILKSTKDCVDQICELPIGIFKV